MYVCVSRYLKEELYLAIDKRFQFFFYFLLHYPTRDLQRDFWLAINNLQLSEQL